MPLTVQFTRGGLVETVHPFSAALVGDGEVRWAVGPDVAGFWRSASKPFQLQNSLAQLPPGVVAGLDDRTLAIGAASHSGEPGHTALVAALLTQLGVDAAGLQCGAHPPMHEASARAIATPTVLHSNCSGKHTFMLAASLSRGWDPDYRPLAHPLQAHNHALIDELAGVHHGTGIDGCSIPTFHAPLSAQARAWSRLAEAMATSPDAPLGRIGWAMHREPWCMSGTDRLDLAVVQQASEPVTVKIGAEGLFCVARPRTRQGVAVKVHTGNSDALAVAVKWALAELGVSLSGEWSWAKVLNIRGAEVGTRIVAG